MSNVKELFNNESECKKTYYEDGKLKNEHWYLNGEFHKEDGPARINYHKNGNKSAELWYSNGKPHRENEPAFFAYYEDGSLLSNIWASNGEMGRENDFGLIEYYKNGAIKSKMYMINTTTAHNENGPAGIWYDENGNIIDKKYSIKGKQLTEEEFKEYHATKKLEDIIK